MMAIIFIAGLFSAFAIKKQMFPDLTINTISIQVPYLGAAPQEVEEGIIDKIEKSIKHTLAFTEGPTSGTVFVELKKPEELEMDSDQVIERWRQQIPQIAGLKYTDVGGAMGFSGPDIAFQLKSNSLDDLKKAYKLRLCSLWLLH